MARARAMAELFFPDAGSNGTRFGAAGGPMGYL